METTTRKTWIDVNNNGTAYARWVDCRFCGSVPPAGVRSPKFQQVETYQAEQTGARRGRQVLALACSVCGSTTDRHRFIKVARKSDLSSRPCGDHCLNGKHSCNCKCRGLCHGAGQCRCGEAGTH